MMWLKISRRQLLNPADVAQAVALAAAALLMSSCGGTTGAPGSSVPPGFPSTTPTSSTSVPGTAAGSGQAAIGAYLGMWQSMAAAATTSNWQDPELSRYATGDALQVITKSLYADHLNGTITKGHQNNSPHLSSPDAAHDAATSVVTDCGDDSDWLKYRADSGQPVDNVPGGRRSITAEVTKQSDGRWLVTRFAVEAVGTC